MSWLSDLKYDLNDAFHTSEAEGKVDKYSDAMDKLNTILEEVTANLKIAYEGAESLAKLSNVNDISMGKMIFDYNDKVWDTRMKLLKIINYYSTKKSKLEWQIEDIKKKKSYWEKIEEKEDESHKEYKGGKYGG